MDYEKIIRKTLGIALLIFIVSIYGHFALYPHYYHTFNDYSQPEIQIIDLSNGDINTEGLYIPSEVTNKVKAKIYYGTSNNGSSVPLFSCDNVSDIISKEYSDVFIVKRYWQTCIMWNLPPNDPYISKVSTFRWFVVRNQAWFGLVFLILTVFLFIYDKKREKYKYLKQQRYRY